jgi:hypothetical protein
VVEIMKTRFSLRELKLKSLEEHWKNGCDTVHSKPSENHRDRCTSLYQYLLLWDCQRRPSRAGAIIDQDTGTVVSTLFYLIRAVMFHYNSRKYRAVALIDIIGPDILVSQTRYMSVAEYLERFRTQLDVLKSAGGDICTHPGMVQDELDRAGVGTSTSRTDIEAATASARHRFEGALFLVNSNQEKYGRLVQELANDFNKGRDSYPVNSLLHTN